MKWLFKSRAFQACAVIVILYVILFQTVAHTRLIEKLMAMTFNWWEMLLVVAFILCRLFTYLFVPAILVAMVVERLTRALISRRDFRD